MKKNLLLCSISIILLSAGVASAKKSPYQNINMASSWSEMPATVTSDSSRNFKNISDAARWSSLPRPLTPNSTKKGGRASRLQDPVTAEELFGLSGGTWKQCVRQCVESALGGSGTLCFTNCTGCALVGSPWNCAICAACGVVAFASVEFCTLHCCANPGCPAMVEIQN